MTIAVAMKNHDSVKIIRKALQEGYHNTIFSETDEHLQCYHSIIFPHSVIKSCGVVHFFHINIVKWRALEKSLGNCSFVLNLRI